MASSAQYAATPCTSAAIISTANPNRDGTGAVALLLASQPTGARIDDINIQALGVTTAGMVRFYLRKGALYYPLREVTVSAVTPSATLPAFNFQLLNLAWVINTGWELVVSTEKAESFAVAIMRGGAL